MVVEPNVFFKQVTLTLCSSLDVNAALHRCLLYLRRVMPVDKMFLGLYDVERCAINHVAAVDRSGSIKTSCPIQLPPAVGKIIGESIHRVDRLVVDTALDPFTAAVAPYVKNQGCSEIILPLHTGDDQIGYLVMQVKGPNRYNDQHMQLMTSVREPLTIAMANAMGHREVVELKDRLMDDNQLLKQQLSERSDTEIVGADSGLRHVMEMVQQIAPLQSTALLLGETGVGKEVLASAIHRLSPRREGPFIKVNCGAIPESLIDSELFGHEKGAFSGAVAKNRGRFERAHGGTIFLDEIGELPPAAQIRLLRVLQSREIERVGGSAYIPVDIRVIAATHRNLEKMVEQGQFREDLWFRLNAFPIMIPPLRHRREDIPLLLQHFLERKAMELGFRCPPPIAQGALEVLGSHSWPGNVRELENVVERALIQNKGRALTLDSFTLSQRPNGPLTALDDTCGCVFPCLATSAPVQGNRVDKDNFVPLDVLVAEHIEQALKLCSGRIHGPGGAAQLLGVNPSTLRNRMNKLGVRYGRKGAA